MTLFPKDVVKKAEELGFHVIVVIELYKVWSVVGLKGERKFNVQLSKDDLSVDSIYLLRYKFNQWGSRVVDVERVLIQHRNQEKVSVI